ncbi:MAG: hypothetical protein EXR79_01820 [Myxococcales bacterium]|nr:hypothetical protein [Myxococcales bacterium]
MLQVRNAATRDREVERMVRRYVAFVRTMVDGSAPRALTGSPDTSDPIVLLRLHAGLVRELGNLLHTATVLQERLEELSILYGIDLQGPVDAPRRAGRVRLLVRVCSCIRRDAEARVAQGQFYSDAQRGGRSDADLRAERSNSRATADDLAMLARTVDCSRLAMKTFPRD